MLIKITDPVPTTANFDIQDGRVRLSFEIDLAPAIGRAVLSGKTPDVSALIRNAIQNAVLAMQVPQGQC